MSTIVSSVPGIMAGLLNLIATAGQQQNPPVAVFPYAVEQYQPGSYVVLTGVEHLRYEWEAIWGGGGYAVRELYDLTGVVTVFTGASAVDQPTVAIDTLTQTFALMQACVMAPVFSNMNAPTFGTTGPSAQIIVPNQSPYTAGPGLMDAGQAGWEGTITWSFSVTALLNPS